MERLPACLVSAALALSGPVAAQAPNSWLCIVDQATGFSNSSGTWRSVDFKAGTRYIIKRSQRSGVTWQVEEFGKPAIIPTAICKVDFNESKFLICSGLGNEFRFSASTGRFMNTYSLGYWTYRPGAKLFGQPEKDGDEGTPSIEIGTCSSL